MTEEKKAGAPTGGKPEPVAQETELLAELARVRSRSHLFKVVAVSLSVVFALVLVLGFLGYRKVMEAKAVLDGISQGFQPLGDRTLAGSGDTNIPAPLRALSSAGSADQSISGLGLLSMPDSGGEQEEAGELQAPAAGETDQKIGLAMAKYAKRPIVKEFLAELEKDSDFARLQAKNKGGGPLAVIAGIQKSPKMRALLMKYTVRPDFMKLLTEVMRDPEIKPYLRGGMPGAGRPMPGATQPTPVSAVVLQPASQPAPDAAQEEDGELTFNAAAVSGAVKPAYRSGGKPPPPVDNGQ